MVRVFVMVGVRVRDGVKVRAYLTQLLLFLFPRLSKGRLKTLPEPVLLYQEQQRQITGL